MQRRLRDWHGSGDGQLMPGPRLCKVWPTTREGQLGPRKVKKKQRAGDVLQLVLNSARELVDYQHCLSALRTLIWLLPFLVLSWPSKKFFPGLSGFLLWRLSSVVFSLRALHHSLVNVNSSALRCAFLSCFLAVLQCISDFGFDGWPFKYRFSVKCSGWTCYSTFVHHWGMMEGDWVCGLATEMAVLFFSRMDYPAYFCSLTQSPAWWQVHPQNDPLPGPPFFSAQSTRNDPDPLSAKRQRESISVSEQDLLLSIGQGCIDRYVGLLSAVQTLEQAHWKRKLYTTSRCF